MRIAPLAMTALVGCAAARAPKPDPSAAATPVAPLDWHLVAYAEPPHYAILVEKDSTQTERFLLGGQRVERRGASLTFSDESTLTPLARSCRSGSGWLHVLKGGAVFGSDTFLGALKSVGAAATEDSILQCGPVLVMHDGAGDVMMWGRSGPRPMAAAKGLVGLHFSSESEGRAIASPDRLLETHDGGRTFVEPAPRPNVGGPPEWLGSEIMSRPNRVEREPFEPLLAGWLHRAVQTEAGALVGGLELADGTWVRSASFSGTWTPSARENGHELLSIRTPDGKVVDRSFAGGCHLHRWGAKLLADCYEGRPAMRVLYPDAEATIPEPPLRPRFVVADPAGRFVAAEAWPLDPSAPNDAPLLLFDGTRWHVRTDLHLTPIAMDDGKLVACGEHPSRCRVLPLSAPESSGYDLGDTDLRIASGCVVDGKLFFIRRTGSPHDPPLKTELVGVELGASGPGERTSLPISDEADGVRFADRLHGVFWTSAGKPRVTVDGGKTWKPLEDVVAGARWSESRCWPAGCTMGDRFVWTRRAAREEALADFRRPLPAAPAPPRSLPATPAAPEPSTVKMASYECHGTAPLDKSALFGFEGQAKELSQLPATGGLLRRSSSGGFAWRGQDERGAFEVQTPILSGEGSDLHRAFGHVPKVSPHLWPLLVARRYAVLLRVDESGSCAYILHADGRVVRLPSDKRAGFSAVPLPNGGALIAIGDESNLDVLALGEVGDIVARRWLLIGSGGAHRALFINGSSGPGIGVTTPGGVELYSLVAGSPPSTLMFDSVAAFPDCRERPNPDATTIYGLMSPHVRVDGVDAVPLVYPEHWAPPSTANGLVEVGPKGACLRGALIGGPFVASLRAERGVLRGTLVGPKSLYPIVCRRGTKDVPTGPH